MATLFPSKAPQTITLACWNVNSVRARLPLVEEFLRTASPDVVCIQATKCLNGDFPREVIEDLGYNIAHHGQKTFNGVAILSKFPLDDIVCGLPPFSEDEQARYIEAGINVGKDYFRIASVYVPNGQEVGSDKYAYKLNFLKALKEHASEYMKQGEKMLMCGDYNIAPADRDVHDPKAWHEQVLCSTKERQAFFEILNLGYTDVFGFEEPAPFTWWDYRGGSFEKNHGLRIDHILASPDAADRVSAMTVHKDVRSFEKTSDHAPISVTLSVKS